MSKQITGRNVPWKSFFRELITKDENEYTFFPNTKGLQFFRIRPHAKCLAKIALTTDNYVSKDKLIFEIILGESNNQSSLIVKNNFTSESTFAPTPDLLSFEEFKGFWVFWKNMVIQVGKENELEPFITLKDEDVASIKYIGVCSVGSTATWIVEEPHYQCWVNATEGLVPPAAFSGGEYKKEPIYIIRANCHGGFVPGKLISSQGVAYVPSDGAENACTKYEVLCEFRGQWMRCAENEIPMNAVIGGYSADGETFYIGRVRHQGTLIIGKISNGVCYGGYMGMELSFNKFEILIT